MKKADKPVIIINGDNNKISLGEKSSHLSVAITIALGVVVSAAILAVSHCCPELLAHFVRLLIGIAFGG